MRHYLSQNVLVNKKNRNIANMQYLRLCVIIYQKTELQIKIR